MLNGDYILSRSEEYPVMAARMLMVKHLPVRGILTTNYDQLLCLCTEVRHCLGLLPVHAPLRHRWGHPPLLLLNRQRSPPLPTQAATDGFRCFAAPLPDLHCAQAMSRGAAERCVLALTSSFNS